MTTKLGLTINEAKTSLRNARKEHFDFLGNSFGPHWFKKNGKWYVGACPSKKSVKRIRMKVKGLLVPGNMAPWEDVRDELNSMLLGWSAYFSYGTYRPAERGLGSYVDERVRDFLVRRHKVRGRGSHQVPYERVYGEMGVIRLERLPRSKVPAVGVT